MDIRRVVLTSMYNEQVSVRFKARKRSAAFRVGHPYVR